MSRSRRYSPIIPMTTACSEKSNKRIAARRHRRRVAEQLVHGRFDEMPSYRRVYDIGYLGAKDGHCRLYGVDPVEWELARLLRK